MNINEYNLQKVEEILKGRISKNPNRFECANGVVFSVNENTNIDEMYDHLNGYGVEFYELNENIFYTETIMSVAEFSYMKYVKEYIQVA